MIYISFFQPKRTRALTPHSTDENNRVQEILKLAQSQTANRCNQDSTSAQLLLQQNQWSFPQTNFQSIALKKPQLQPEVRGSGRRGLKFSGNLFSTFHRKEGERPLLFLIYPAQVCSSVPCPVLETKGICKEPSVHLVCFSLLPSLMLRDYHCYCYCQLKGKETESLFI